MVDILKNFQRASRADIHFSASGAGERARRLHANQFGTTLVFRNEFYGNRVLDFLENTRLLPNVGKQVWDPFGVIFKEVE